LKSLAAVEVGGELSAGKKPEILRLPLPANPAHLGLSHFQIEGCCTVSSRSQKKARDYEVLVGFEMTLVVLWGVRGQTEQADQRIAARTRSVGTRSPGLDGSDVAGELGGEIYARLVHHVPGPGAATDKPVLQNHFALLLPIVRLSPTHLNF